MERRWENPFRQLRVKKYLPIIHYYRSIYLLPFYLLPIYLLSISSIYYHLSIIYYLSIIFLS